MTTWAVYCTMLVSNSRFPIPTVPVVFFFSAALAAGLDKIQRIRWHLFFIHTFGFSSAVALMGWISLELWPMDFSRGWEMGLRKGLLLTHPKIDALWPIVIFTAMWLLPFWLAGVAWSRRSHTHQSVCNRFDLGASLLFLLFILKIVLSKRFDILVEASYSIYLLVAFFLFGLFAIGSAKKHESRTEKEVIRSGMLPIVVIGIVLFGVYSITFFISYFETAAQSAYNTIKDAASPVTSWFAAVLIFLFKPSSDTATGMKESQGATPDGNPPVESILSQNDLFMHGAGLLYGIMSILTLACTCWLIYGWLTTPSSPKGITKVYSSAGWIKHRLKYAIYLIGQQIRGMRRKKGIGYYYTYLIKWGKRSGVAHCANETPLEYAYRLAKQFQEVDAIVIKIARYYNRYAYGAGKSDDAILVQLHCARRILQSPKLWPMRLRVLVFGSKSNISDKAVM